MSWDTPFEPNPFFANPVSWYPCVPEFERAVTRELRDAWELELPFILKALYDGVWAANGGVVGDGRYERFFYVTYSEVETVVIDEVSVEVVTVDFFFGENIYMYFQDECWDKDTCVTRLYPNSPIPFGRRC